MTAGHKRIPALHCQMARTAGINYVDLMVYINSNSERYKPLLCPW